MAAYAALVSLMHIIDNLQLHPRPPISLHKKQVQLLTQKITFLQEFLEAYNPQISYGTEADPLESRIADAAYAAEDAIESHIADQITGKKISLGGLYRALKMVIKEMALIETEAMGIKQTLGVQHQLHTKSTPSDSFKSSSISTESRMMVGADDVMLEMKEKLKSDRRDLQIISIVGMGGSGKTTLAMNIYQDSDIKEHFDICAWATISEKYSIPEMLIQVLRELNQNVDQNGELGQILHQHLTCRRYLIILDDMWSIEALDGIRKFLPNDKNCSRVVVTTRLSNLTSNLSNLENLKMSLLNEVHSWELLSKTVFGEKSCPPELEEIGKRIGIRCKGLPLSILVIGGLLAKSEHTREFWESIEENLNSIVNSEDDERCFKILYMSYKQLPVYLKPCFLYMGVYPEDEMIRRSMLVKLWVAEGFLKPISGKTLEEIADVYLKDLVDRNLVLIDEIGISGEIKWCKIHDLLRDLCLREAEKESFYTASPQTVAPNAHRRIVISKIEDINARSSMSPVRSLTWNLEGKTLISLGDLRLLRILNPCRYAIGVEFLENLHELVNLRILAISNMAGVYSFPSSIWQLWNLQSLYAFVNAMKFIEPINIWHMPHIRHVDLDQEFELADPPNDQDNIVLGNLQTLEIVRNLKFSEQVVKRIPNIKKLKIRYCFRGVDEDSYCINNLNCLVKLESLRCSISQGAPDSMPKLINFPNSLKKLSLCISVPNFYWEGILDKIGVLPHLQKLTLTFGRFKEGRWETTEGQFRSLKFLTLFSCRNLKVWTTKNSHFPCLEQLDLCGLRELEEIPLEFAEISTLGKIRVNGCSKSAVESAERILEEQENTCGEKAELSCRIRTNYIKGR